MAKESPGGGGGGGGGGGCHRDRHAHRNTPTGAKYVLSLICRNSYLELAA